jgi:hypothetical protein
MVLSAVSRFLGNGNARTLKAVRLCFFGATNALRIDAKHPDSGQWMTSVVMPMSLASAPEARDLHPTPAPAAVQEGEAEPAAEAPETPGPAPAAAEVPAQEPAPEPPAQPAAREKHLADMRAFWARKRAERDAARAAEPLEPSAQEVGTTLGTPAVSSNGSTAGEAGATPPVAAKVAPLVTPKAFARSAGNGWDNPEIRAKRIDAIKAARERAAK